MESREFETLVGRIEGIAQGLMHLVALLEMQEGLNGPRYCRMLLAKANNLPADQPCRASTEAVLYDLVTQLDLARENRRSWADSPENRLNRNP